MANLIYSALCSLDGYIEDSEGKFDWAMPSEEVHEFVNDLERPVGTYLYGRRMYEVMRAWQTMATVGEPDCMRDFAEIWRAADKVVYSHSLAEVSTPKTTLERGFDPDAIRAMKSTASADISIGGPNLAAHAFAAGLIDEFHIVVSPVSVGGGKPALPVDLRVDFELIDEHRFENGAVHLHYRV